LQIMWQTQGFAISADCAPASGAAFKVLDGSAGCAVRIDKNRPPQSRWERFLAQVRRDLISAGPVMAALTGAGVGYAIRAMAQKRGAG
jgi:hypothetical protein